MANQLSGETGATPNTYTKHQRHRKFARIGSGADQFSAFLTATATRLSSTSAVVFAKLTKYGAAAVKAATNISQLP